MTLNILGEMGELKHLVDEALRRAQDRGDVHLTVNMLPWAAMVALAQDDTAAAERLLGTTLDLCQSIGIGFQIVSTLFVIRLGIDLYRQPGDSAYRQAMELWPRLLTVGIRRAPQYYCEALKLRARCILAAAAAASDTERPRLLLATEREVRCLERVGRPAQSWVRGVAVFLRAGITAVLGDAEGAARRYADAAAHLAAAGLGLHAAVARRRQGEIINGDHGQALIAEADTWMTTHGVKNPSRMCDMLAPR